MQKRAHWLVVYDDNCLLERSEEVIANDVYHLDTGITEFFDYKEGTKPFAVSTKRIMTIKRLKDAE